MGQLAARQDAAAGASSIPFSDYKRKRGDRVGLNWRITTITGRRTVRHVVFDTNYWKSFIHSRLAVPMGDPGCLSLFDRSAERHRLIAEHLTSEYRVKTEGRGRTVDEWKLRVDGLDNDWLDCLVGAAVTASMQGETLFATETKPAPRPKIRLSALQGGRQRISQRRPNPVRRSSVGWCVPSIVAGIFR